MRQILCILTILVLLPACAKVVMSPEELKTANARLLEAARKGDIQKVRKLVAAGVDIDGVAEEGYPALHVAAMDNDPKLAKLLIECGADIDATDGLGNSPLCLAVEMSNEGVARMLVEQGADVRYTNKFGNTRLHFTSSAEIARMLLSNGTDVNAKDNRGYTPLDKAVELEYHKVIEVLREAGASHSNPSNYRLLKAAENGDLRLVKEMIAAGVDMEARDSRGYTPLMLAAWRGREGVVKFLVSSGANVNQDTSSFSTRAPLMMAVSQENTEVVQYLIDNGACVNAQDVFGITSLGIAVSCDEKDLVEVLIAAGADVNLPNYQGDMPLDLACSEEVKKLLRRHGALTGEELKKKEGK